MKKRFKVVVWHGEHRSLFYVMYIPDGEVYRTCYNREDAERWCAILEAV